LVWSFRIVAGGVLGQEALGFGDVTLMAMVGAHFGWQIVLLAFFLAPLFGVALVIAYWAITRDSAIPFGPYLAAATAYLMLDWARVWDAVSIVFVPVRVYLIFLAVLLVLLGTLLWLVRALKVLLLTGRQER
jgi:leader peptidase (prepilin peptidase) / N-methyltransferase